MNINLIFVILLASGEIYATNAAKTALGNNLDKRTKPEPKFPSEANDLKLAACADIEVISPCSCFINTTYGVVMDCSNVTTVLELQTIFARSFPQNDMYKFSMNQSKIISSIDDLPLGVFGSKTFMSVELSNINFGFNFNTFDYMNATLEYFYVYSAPIFMVNHNFNAYTTLTGISLIYCSLTDFLISSPTLEILVLSETSITEREGNIPYLFGSMQNLKELEISHGDLYKMPDTSGYPKLEKLVIYDNHISFIEVSQRTERYLNIFHAWNNDFQAIPLDSIRMSEESEFFMADNELDRLEEQIWRNIFLNASAIHLYDNPLDCTCVMAWMLLGNDTNGTSFMDKLKGDETCDDGGLLTELDKDSFNICK